MGPEDNGSGSFTLYTMDGVKLGPVRELAEIAAEAGEKLASEMIGLMAEFQVTIEVKTPKHLKCRDRKRFIKLMMGEGVDRNTAARFADYLGRCTCYQWAWECYLFSGVRIER